MSFHWMLRLLQRGDQISMRREAHEKKYPDAKVISLGIGDTTQPIPSIVTSAMAEYALALSTPEGYQGYGPEQGQKSLRKAIADVVYPNMGIRDTEVFISDGAQCDIARLQMMFGRDVTIAVQDPTFPGGAALFAYSFMHTHARSYNNAARYDNAFTREDTYRLVLINYVYVLDNHICML
ncbi:LL-diaminopimelate aminotransferase, chloroplastic [Triticum urartu]|uniref:LL-diaminopimelate aminotransferase, chloroplastic n=1 Tax=Triticum urartu TaxID=4572 RepID=M7Z2X3_TRIUA|nr:LL-diaminopimelate aminotransferase, chloroplastic [Triticum urartu]